MDNVADIKEKIDIVGLINEHVPLKRSGKNYKGLCPFHGEKTPSFMVSPDLQQYRCFGCSKSGDIFNFIMELEGVDFSEALKILADKAGVQLKYDAKSKEKNSEKQKILEMNKLAARFYHHLLVDHEFGKSTLEYLKERGVKAETINEFQLGYAPSAWENLTKLLTKKGYSLNQAVSAGLSHFRGRPQNGAYDMFRGRLMFPLVDHMNRVIGFAGRALEEDQMPKYINTAETPIFHKEKFLFGLNLAKPHIRKKNEVIVVEGEFDMISPYQAGIKNIVASKGTALTPPQCDLLKRYADTAILIFDNDPAGMDAAIRGVKIIQNSGLNIKIAMLPDDVKDPDDLVKKDPDEFKKAVKNAMPLWDFFFAYASKKFNFDDVFERKSASEFLLGMIKTIDDEVIKAEYLKKFSDVFDIDERAAGAQMDKIKIDASRPFPNTPNTSHGQPPASEENNVSEVQRYPPSEVYLLSLLLKCDKEKLGVYLGIIESDYFENQTTKELFKNLSSEYENNKNLDFKTFYDKLEVSPDTHSLFENIYLIEFLEEDSNNPDAIDLEIASVIKRLRMSFLKRKLKDITKAMKKAEAMSDKKKIKDLSQQVQDYSQELSEISH